MTDLRADIRQKEKDESLSVDTWRLRGHELGLAGFLHVAGTAEIFFEVEAQTPHFRRHGNIQRTCMITPPGNPFATLSSQYRTPTVCRL